MSHLNTHSFPLLLCGSTIPCLEPIIEKELSQDSQDDSVENLSEDGTQHIPNQEKSTEQPDINGSVEDKGEEAIERTSVEKKSIEKKSVEKQSVEKMSEEEMSAEKQPVDKKSGEKQSVENKLVEKHSANKKSAKKQSEETNSVEKYSEGKKSMEKQSWEKNSVGKKATEKQSPGKKSVEKMEKDSGSEKENVAMSNCDQKSSDGSRYSVRPVLKVFILNLF